ncbi:hypothetical protein ACJRO7_002907 [Eucalyptus globulus]|uniref:Uncharacterized protein n=1 Tax=Eucalyptus globulus TaxID=34317 RepID=A0ABD3LVX9_EUCGL
MSTSQVSFGLPEGDSNTARPSSNFFKISPSEDGTKLDRCDPIMIMAMEKMRKREDSRLLRLLIARQLAECPPMPRRPRSEEILNSKTPPSIQSSFALPFLTNFGRKIPRKGTLLRYVLINKNM